MVQKESRRRKSRRNILRKGRRKSRRKSRSVKSRRKSRRKSKSRVRKSRSRSRKSRRIKRRTRIQGDRKIIHGGAGYGAAGSSLPPGWLLPPANRWGRPGDGSEYGVTVRRKSDMLVDSETGAGRVNTGMRRSHHGLQQYIKKDKQVAEGAAKKQHGEEWERLQQEMGEARDARLAAAELELQREAGKAAAQRAIAAVEKEAKARKEASTRNNELRRALSADIMKRKGRGFPKLKEKVDRQARGKIWAKKMAEDAAENDRKFGENLAFEQAVKNTDAPVSYKQFKSSNS